MTTPANPIPAAAKPLQDCGGLLFVNKDATSVSFSNSEEAVRRRINRHVQHWHLETKFATKQSALRETPTLHILKGGYGRRAERTETIRSRLEYRPHASHTVKSFGDALISDARSTPPDTLHPQQPGKEGQIADEDKARTTNSTLTLPPVLCCTGDAIDPFNCTATPIDHTTHELIQHYVRVIVPSTFRVEAQAYRFPTTRHTASIVEVVRRSLSNEMHTAALLAVSASRMTHVVKKDLGANSAERFMYEAIKKLRQHLRRDSISIDQATILDIFWLFQAESYSRSYDASMVHLRVVKQLVESIGGFGTLDRYMMESVMIGDILVSVETFVPPIFPFVCDPGALDPLQRSSVFLKTDLQLGCLGRGFSHETFRPELRLIISDLVSCMQMAQWVWSQSTPDPSDVKWTMLRCYSILHRLLCLGQSQSHPDLFAKEESCRVALLMWLGQVTTTTGIATRSGSMNARRLKDRLLRHGVLNATRRTERRLLAWMLVVGAFATADTDAKAWFHLALRKVLKDLNLTTIEVLRNLLDEYFYHESSQSRSL